MWGVSRPFASDTSPKRIDREGLGKRIDRTGTRQRRIIHLQNPSKLTEKQMDKVRRIVHPKLRLFYFQIKTWYLCDANYPTDNPSQTDNPSLVWIRPFYSTRNSFTSLVWIRPFYSTRNSFTSLVWIRPFYSTRNSFTSDNTQQKNPKWSNRRSLMSSGHFGALFGFFSF